jgi:hypothetical protein
MFGPPRKLFDENMMTDTKTQEYTATVADFEREKQLTFDAISALEASVYSEFIGAHWADNAAYITGRIDALRQLRERAGRR